MGVLARIQKSPEEARFRKLRLSNASLSEKVCDNVLCWSRHRMLDPKRRLLTCGDSMRHSAGSAADLGSRCFLMSRSYDCIAHVSRSMTLCFCFSFPGPSILDICAALCSLSGGQSGRWIFSAAGEWFSLLIRFAGKLTICACHDVA